jgi:predicted RNA-binding Zn-ribbon protein involved in translation (DUF1610 family)
MNCERIREQIPEVLAGRLDKNAREQLVEHLEGCAGCRAEVAELNAVWRGMETLRAESDDAPLVPNEQPAPRLEHVSHKCPKCGKAVTVTVDPHAPERHFECPSCGATLRTGAHKNSDSE